MWLPILLALIPAATPPIVEGDADAGSLEEFLRKARSKKESRLESLRAPVAAVVAKLESMTRPRPKRTVEGLRRDLDALGTEAATLLLPHIDPGEPSSDGSRFRAEEVAEALIRMHTAAITAPLITVASGSNQRAQRLAIRVLGHAPDRARAGAFLTELFRSSRGSTRQECVLALARLGGRENAKVLEEALRDPSEEIVRAVLSALAEARGIGAIDGIRVLLRDHSAAGNVVEEILGYFRACPETASEEVVIELIQLAAAGSELSEKDRLLILEELPRFKPSVDSKLNRAIEPLVSSSDPEIQEAAQICMALLGDRKTRRDLKRKYDEWIREQDNWAAAYEKRGALLLKLEEYADSAKDYKRAIDMRESDGRPVPRNLYIEMARAHILGGKLRQSHEALQDAYLSPGQIKEVAKDPDFAELVDHSRYGKLFE
jgi:hypothetical protein